MSGSEQSVWRLHKLGLYGDVSTASTSATGSSTTTVIAAKAGSASSASPFVINITWDASVANAPAAFKTAVIAAAQYLESEFTAAVTVNIDVGYGEVGGSAIAGGALGESSSYLVSVSYASLRAALAAHNNDATTAAVLASLPASSPVSGNIAITTAEAKALGLMSASTAADGYVGFSSSLGFTYNNANGVAAGTYDFTGVALHELTEVMGRELLTGTALAGSTKYYTLLDLLHYSAAGTRDLSASQAGYFSANGGTTNGGAFNTVSGGDSGDWASSMGNNSFAAFANSGAVLALTAGDLTEMDALGWKLVSGTPAVAPSGISIKLVTATAPLQASAGLAGGKALMSLTETGGTSGDSFTYSLSGSGSSSFSLSSAGVLSTVAAGVPGGTAGKFYALGVTVKDTSNGTASAAQPVDVVVGGTAAATVDIAKFSGFSASAPTFIYALAGSETFDATGVTVRSYFMAGTGADVFIGGSGGNTYVFGSTGDAKADLIKNFSVAKDLVDLTGISTHLAYAGAVSGTTLAADSIGYKISGGTTYLYVNTSNAAEALTATNMKIGMTGSIVLTTANILHN